MKNKPYSLTALSFAVAFASTVILAHGAPPAGGGAVGAVGNLGVGLGLGNAGMGASSAGAFNGSAHGAGAAQGGGAFGNGGGVGASLGDVESIGMRQDRLRAQASANATDTADAHASVMGEARGRTVAKLAASGASASLNTSATVHAIQGQAMASRETLLAELHTRVDASAKAMATVRKSGAKLDGDAKANFKAADTDVKAKAKTLKKSMKAAEKADADKWGDARTNLATDFDAYASAVAHAEAASHSEAKIAAAPKS